MKSLSSPVPRPGWRVVVVICVSIAILGFGAYYAISTQTGKNENGDAGDLTQPASESETSRLSEELKSGIILEETRITVPESEGALGWRFGAEKIEYDADRNGASLQAVEGTRFIEGRPELRVWAGAVNLDFATGRVDFEDYVTVKSDEGHGFSAAGATWDPGTKSFRAYGNIRYENGASEIFGDEMEIDLEFEIARVKGNVRFRSPAFKGPEGGFAR